MLISAFLFGMSILTNAQSGYANDIQLENDPGEAGHPAWAISSGDTMDILYVPFVGKSAYQLRYTGHVTLLSGPDDCDGEKCYQVEVSCPVIVETIRATLKVGGPSGQTKKGTILFASGWIGTYFWEGSDDPLYLATLEQETMKKVQAVNTNNRAILDHLQADGFQTIQIRWDNNQAWYQSKNGTIEGQANLACRSASVARWVYQQFHLSDTSHPYCGVGHSNGASQMSYSLAHYALFDIFSAVIFESGPNWSHIEYACIFHPDHADFFASGGERNEIDRAFGGTSGIRPCYNQDSNYINFFREASMMNGNWRYQYPKTQVSFIFGSLDDTITAKQGELYYDRLVQEATPLLYREVVNGAPHEVTSTPQGAQALENAIRNGCKLH
jgi:hypothetical protein